MPKTPEFEGMEGPKIKAIDEAAEAYVGVRDRRMKLTEDEIAAKTNLIDVCRRNEDKLSHDGNGTLRYRYDDMVVEWTKADKIKVKHASDETADEE